MLALTSSAAADPSRVLPPSAGPRLEAAIARAEPALVLEDAAIEVDRVDATVCGDSDAGKICFKVLLTDPLAGCQHERVGPWCLGFPDGPPVAAGLAETLIRSLKADADSDFWKVVSARSVHGASEPAAEQAEPAEYSTQSLAPGGLAVLGWQLGMLALLGSIGVWFVRARPWRNPGRMRILLEIMGLFLVGFLVRHLGAIGGPGNLYSQLPNPAHPPVDFELFGPGLSAWALGWFGLFGADDGVAFLAGAVAGALTLIPVYCLAWMATGDRRAGLLAGLLLALWPIHVRLSPTDDASVLIALLLTTATALVVIAARTGSGSLLVAAWLAFALAATTRPEPALAGLPLGLLVLWQPETRKLQFRPVVLALSSLVLAAAGLVLFFTISKSLRGGFSPAGSLQLHHLAKLLGAEGGSILAPPRSQWILTLFFVIGFSAGLWFHRGRTALWLAVALLPAVPTASLAGQDVVTARYQLALVPLAAACLAVGWLGIHHRLAAWQPRWGRIALPALALGPLLVAAVGVVRPPPEPTFRLEYAFFRNNLEKIPPDCRLIQVRWNVDLGLGVPVHLTGLLGTGHTWVTPDAELDPDTTCLVYWQPASCRATAPEPIATEGLLPDCKQIETRFQLEPLAMARLPARTGFCETYREDPVPVGFYRLRVRRPAEAVQGVIEAPDGSSPRTLGQESVSSEDQGSTPRP